MSCWVRAVRHTELEASAWLHCAGQARKAGVANHRHEASPMKTKKHDRHNYYSMSINNK